MEWVGLVLDPIVPFLVLADAGAIIANWELKIEN
jgi:hypothetical protein